MSATPDDIMAALTVLSGKVDDNRTAIKALEAKFDRLETKVDRLENKVDAEFRVINARLDEQRSTVNALIPTRLAAVPTAA